MSKCLYPALDPRQYLDFAEELSSRPESYALRTAADRVYYATFLTCRDQLTAKDYFTSGYASSDHQYLQSALRRKEVLGSFGDQINHLRRARGCATYDVTELSSSHTHARALDKMIQIAKEIINRVDRLAPRS